MYISLERASEDFGLSERQIYLLLTEKEIKGGIVRSSLVAYYRRHSNTKKGDR